MKFLVLAVDYDGTIAHRDRLEPSARDAIAEARARGVDVLLVTGRTLDALREVAGDLHFVDGIVAENGCVVHFPEEGYSTVLAPLVPPTFLEELTRRGVPFTAGRCLVDADAGDAPRLLDAIRALEVPLVLAFNRGRVMVLPQGVSKATGLQSVLDMMRVSPRNAVAIGDAENDHELLRLAEIGAAVEWGSPRLRTAADVVVPGHGPSDTARYIRRLTAHGLLPSTVQARRMLRLGHTDDGREFSLKVRGRNVLIAGDARSGKSWVAGLLCEQLIFQGYCVCVMDPEGDYRSLEALPGVTLLGGEHRPPTPRELIDALRYPDRSVIIDLSRLSHETKIEYMRTALPAVNALRRQTGLPHRILVDEAHYFLHGEDAAELLDLEYNGYTVVTYRASRLPEALMSRTDVIIVTCESDPAEMEALRQRCATCQQVDPAAWDVLGRLGFGQAAALPVTEEAGGALRTFSIGRRLTPHVRHRQKYVDVPVTEHWAFAFHNGGGAPKRARTLRQFVAALEGLDESRADGYLRRGDFSRWIADVFGDHTLAADLRHRERDYVEDARPDTLKEMATAIRARYDLTADDADDQGLVP